MLGIEIIGLIMGSKAESSGLKVGDKVLFFNGISTKTLSDYIKAKCMETDIETISVNRNGEILNFEWRK